MDDLHSDDDEELFNNAALLKPCIREHTLGNIVSYNTCIYIDLRKDHEFRFDEHFFDIPADSWLSWKIVERKLNIDIVGFKLSRNDTLRSNARCNQLWLIRKDLPLSINNVVHILTVL